MLVKEYRVILPIDCEEYPIAHRFATAEVTRRDVALGDKIRIVQTQPLSSVVFPDGHESPGDFIHKVYHLSRQVPRWAKLIAPKELLIFHEKTWTSYPFSRTEFSNPDFLQEKLYVRLDSFCVPDHGTSHNVHNLSEEQLSHREVIYLDIANDPVATKDYSSESDPQTFQSTKTGRGLLAKDWKETAKPVMCCYKLMMMDFKWLGLQDKVEKYAHEAERKVFNMFYRQLFCWIDKWYGLSTTDLTQMELAVYAECAQRFPSVTPQPKLSESDSRQQKLP